MRVTSEEYKRSRFAVSFRFFLHHTRKDKYCKSTFTKSLTEAHSYLQKYPRANIKAMSLQEQCVEMMGDGSFNGTFGGKAEVWVSERPEIILQLATPHSDKRNVCFIAAYYRHPYHTNPETNPVKVALTYDLLAENNLDQLRKLASEKGIFPGLSDFVYNSGTRVVVWFTIRKYSSTPPTILNLHF